VSVENKKQRSFADSFIEGFAAPWVEFIVSIIITVMMIMIGAFREAGEVIGQALNTTSNVSIVSFNLIDLLLPLAVFIMSVIDMFRNLVVGFLFPAHATAHIVGEGLSLIIFFPVLMMISKNVIINCLFSMIFLVLGIVIRFYVEYERSKVEYWGY